MKVSKIGLVVGPLIVAGAVYGVLAAGGAGEKPAATQPAGAPLSQEQAKPADPVPAQPAKAEPAKIEPPKAAPAPQPSPLQPATATPSGVPLGFGKGLNLPADLPVTRTFESGLWGGGDGNFFTLVHGSAQAESVPGLGKAPQGISWVLVDAQVWLLSPMSEPAQLNTMFQFVLENTKLSATLEPHLDASAQMGAPFVSTAVLGPQQTARGLLVYAVPTDWLKPGSSLWMTIKSGVGKHPSKRAVDPWNSMLRGSVVVVSTDASKQ